MSTRTADARTVQSAVRRATLWVVFGAAVAASTAIVISTIVRIAISAVHGQPPIQLIGLQDIMPPSGSSSGYASVAIVFGDASILVVWLACIAVILQSLTQASLAGLIALVAWRLVHEKPFRESLPGYITIGGIVLLAGGLLTQVFVLLTNGVAVLQAYDYGATPGAVPLAGRFDLSFIGMGVLLLLIGAAFRVGARLQRDTEGLV